jgi:DnaJ-class molecular chaperone
MNYDQWKLATPDDDTIECPDCEGEGHSEGSYCCDAYFDEDIKICSSCKDHTDYAECEKCKGTGTIMKFEL